MRRSDTERGFTLIELIAVVILVSILAVNLSSRFNFDYADLQATRDDIVAGLFYAQQVAMARDGAVGAAGVTASFATPGELQILENGVILRSIPFSGDVSVVSSSNTIAYDKLGRLEPSVAPPLPSPPETITLDGVVTITVETTGYVY